MLRLNLFRPKPCSGFFLPLLQTAMLRSALVAQLRPAVAPRSTRSFVSTVLLTKAWENETVNELRKEARKRGLPASVHPFSASVPVLIFAI